MAKIKTALGEFVPDARLIDDRGATKQRKFKAGSGLFRGDDGIERMRDTPINTALSRRQISPAQFTAANKFYNHWYRAGLQEVYGSADLNRVFGSGGGSCGMPVSEVQAFHRQRYRQAVQLIGTRGSWTLERVVCKDIPFEVAGREMGWQNRPQAVAAAIQSARDALDLLCRDWGIND